MLPEVVLSCGIPDAARRGIRIKRVSALALLVTRVALADHHHPAVAADDLAVVADGLDGGVDLHDFFSSLSSPGARSVAELAFGR
jgi:hypothetical protein